MQWISRGKMFKFFSLLALSIALFNVGFAQDEPPRPTPKPIAAPTPKLSGVLTKNLEIATEVSRERREQALAKLMEGQRYIWGTGRLKSQSGVPASMKLAKQAFQKAVELDPNLAEGYTALAEIASQTDLEESILLANLATKLNKDNFGGHRMLGRLYTIKSGMSEEKLDLIFTEKAMNSWKEVARIDPRNAEAWAFLSRFYAKLEKPVEEIEALKKWLASAQPVDGNFYRRYTNEQDLTPEGARVKLGGAFLNAGKDREAVEELSRAIADNPQDPEAFELLTRAIVNADAETANRSIESLQQAIFANPENLALVDLLAKIQAKAGKLDEAAKGLKLAIAKLSESNKESSAELSVSLSEIYLDAGKTNEAVAALEDALKLREITTSPVVTDDSRNFALRVFEKIIQIQKNSDRYVEAKATIERSRAVFGKDDLFADKQLISLLQESGKRPEALITVRGLRKRFPSDYSLMRTEAIVLTQLGKVDEGVAILMALIDKPIAVSPIDFDKFSNLIFVSSLYNDAKRGKDAILAAKQALSVATNDETKLLGNAMLASAYEKAGDFKSSEETLRGILKITPNNTLALNNLGYFLAERNNRLPEALELVQKAVKLEPTNGSFLDSLGWVYFKQNKLIEAEKYLREAVRRSPASSTIQEHLGDVYAKQGKAEFAKTAWQKALGLSSSPEQVTRLKQKLKK
jgi:predicted Zn-dependent protease